MKKLLHLMVAITWSSGLFAQETLVIDNLNNWVYTAPPKNLFLNGMPPVNNQISDWTNNGWTYLPALSDEFNTPTLDEDKWDVDYGWGNNYPHVFSWNNSNSNATNANHIFTTSGGNSVLRLQTRKEYVEKTSMPGSYDLMLGVSHNNINEDRPNYRPQYYTGAMIKSKYPPSTPYGYFEIKCKLPSATHLISDFWLWSGGGGNYNEIDIFELEGRNWHATSHWAIPSSTNSYHHTQDLVASDIDFTNNFNTFGMKWEPMRISFYFNNVLVRTITNHIPTLPMNIIANFGHEIYRGFYSNDNYPANFDIDYIRVFQRTTPYIDYTINDDLTSVQVNANYGMPIWINANLPQCYNNNINVNGIYFISFQQCTSTGTPIGIEYSKWLTPAETEKLEQIDARSIATGLGLSLNSGNYYNIKIATSNPWTQKLRRVFITNCSNSVEFSVNQQYRTNFTPIVIGYADAQPKIILDATKTISCNNAYWLSIEPCLPNGDGSANGNTDEYGAWLNSTEISNLSNFDVRAFFLSHFNYTINYNQHYRLKLATGGVFVSKVVILNIQQCVNSSDFYINEENRTDFTPIIIPNNDPIFLKFSPSTICNDSYYVSIEPCNSAGDGSANGNADEVGAWLTETFDNRFKPLHYFDLRNFASNNSISLTGGNYYRVKFATAGVWTSKVQVIYMQPSFCNAAGISSTTSYIDRFEFKGFAFQSGNNSGYKDFTDHGLSDLQNFTPKLNTGSTVQIKLYPSIGSNMRYWKIWIDMNNDALFQTTELVYSGNSTSSILNASFLVPTTTSYGKRRMRVIMRDVSFTSSCGTNFSGEVEDYSVNIADASGYSPYRAINSQTIASDLSLNVYPNPSNGQFNIAYSLPQAGNISIQIYDLQGKLVYTPLNNSWEESGQRTVQISNHELSPGIYVAILQTNERMEKAKFVITE